jgi:hypothetical protein
MGREDAPRRLRRKLGLIFWPVCARPRLSALIPLAPEPRHSGGHRARGFDDRSYPDSQAIVLSMFVDRTMKGFSALATLAAEPSERL